MYIRGSGSPIPHPHPAHIMHLDVGLAAVAIGSFLRQPTLPRHQPSCRRPEPVSEINVAQPPLSQGLRRFRIWAISSATPASPPPTSTRSSRSTPSSTPAATGCSRDRQRRPRRPPHPRAAPGPAPARRHPGRLETRPPGPLPAAPGRHRHRCRRDPGGLVGLLAMVVGPCPDAGLHPLVVSHRAAAVAPLAAGRLAGRGGHGGHDGTDVPPARAGGSPGSGDHQPHRGRGDQEPRGEPGRPATTPTA
jgi:hypothetical protein